MRAIFLIGFLYLSCARDEETKADFPAIVFKDLPTLPLTADSSVESIFFYLIGDWGKGGTSGSIWTRRLVSAKEPTEQSFYDKLSPKGEGNNNKGSGKGDGSNGDAASVNQFAVARSMARYADIFEAPNFVVALGDNFYTKGVASVEDSMWDYLYKDVYMTFPSLNVAWYAILGNHDYGYGETGVISQIARTTQHEDDDSWNMPSTNYTRSFGRYNDGSLIQIIFIDTTTLAPAENGCCNEKSGISTALQEARIRNQLSHIEHMLQEAMEKKRREQLRWLVVAGHYPVFSRGDHGDISNLKLYLQPLLTAYDVDAYVCGHDHISEHLQKDDIDYFVVGAGAMVDKLKTASSDAELIWSGTGYNAFAGVEATDNQLKISFIDTNCSVRYTYTRQKGPPHAEQDNRNEEAPILLTYIILTSSIAAVAGLGLGILYFTSFSNSDDRELRHRKNGDFDVESLLTSTTRRDTESKSVVTLKSDKIANNLVTLAVPVSTKISVVEPIVAARTVFSTHIFDNKKILKTAAAAAQTVAEPKILFAPKTVNPSRHNFAPSFVSPSRSSASRARFMVPSPLPYPTDDHKHKRANTAFF